MQWCALFRRPPIDYLLDEVRWYFLGYALGGGLNRWYVSHWLSESLSGNFYKFSTSKLSIKEQAIIAWSTPYKRWVSISLQTMVSDHRIGLNFYSARPLRGQGPSPYVKVDVCVCMYIVYIAVYLQNIVHSTSNGDHHWQTIVWSQMDTHLL